MVLKKCHEYWHSLCSLQGTGSFCFQEPSTMLCLLVSFGAIGTFVQILKISPTPTWVHDFLLKAPSRQMQPKSTGLGKQRTTLSKLERSLFHWTYTRTPLYNPYGGLWLVYTKDQPRDSDLVFEGQAWGKGTLYLYRTL